MGSSYTDYTYRWKTVHQRGQHRMMGSSYTDHTQVEDCSSAWKPGRGDKEAICRGSAVNSLLGEKREKQPFP